MANSGFEEPRFDEPRVGGLAHGLPGYPHGPPGSMATSLLGAGLASSCNMQQLQHVGQQLADGGLAQGVAPMVALPHGVLPSLPPENPHKLHLPPFGCHMDCGLSIHVTIHLIVTIHLVLHLIVTNRCRRAGGNTVANVCRCRRPCGRRGRASRVLKHCALPCRPPRFNSNPAFHTKKLATTCRA